MVVPEGTTLDVDLRFVPQRRVDVALGLSALGVVVCIVLAIRKPRMVEAEADGLPGLRLDSGGSPVGVPAAVTIGVISALAVCAVAPPAVGVAMGIAAAFGVCSQRGRTAVAFLPAGLISVTAAYGTALLIRYQIAPGVDWVLEMERLHPYALAGVLALGVDVVVDAVWRRGEIVPEPASRPPMEET